MLQRSLSSFCVFTLAVACGASEHSTKGSNGGDAGSGAGSSGSGSGRGGNAGKSGAAGSTSATGGASATGGTGASGGRTGSAGNGGSGGNPVIGGAAGAAASGGTAVGGGGSGTDAGEGGMSAGQGGADDGGTGNVANDDVHGKIIDYWGHPLVGAPVQIGDVRVVTDSDGAFVIHDVADEYDVSFIDAWANPSSKYGWVYQGLTRRDPTLQVLKAFAPHSVGLEITPVDASAPFTGDYRWLLGLGSPNGAATITTAGSNGVEVHPDWRGPISNDWTLHSLYVERTNALPTSYRAYGTSAISVTADEETKVLPKIDLSAETLDTGSVSYSVLPNTGADPANSVFVRFTSGAELPVVNGVTPSGAQPYSYLVPTLPNGSITVAAAETQDDGAFAIVHRDGLSAGASDIEMAVPAPCVPSAPDGVTGVDDSTIFGFTSGDSDAHAFLIHLEDAAFNDGMYIVTAKKQFTLAELPIVDGEFHLTAGQVHHMWVETHGTPATVDAMAQPGGFADAFALDWDHPAGPPHGSGQFTISKRIDFETAP